MRLYLQQFSVFLLLFFVACSNSSSNQAVTTSNQQSSDNTAVAANVNSGESRANPNEAVKVAVEPVTVKVGGQTQMLVKLNVTSPFHINANPASAKNLIPTELTLVAEKGLTPNKPIYPKGEEKKYSFAPDPIEVYTGENTISIQLRAADNIAKGERTLSGKLRVQPCDEEVCYRPQILDVSIPVTIN